MKAVCVSFLSLGSPAQQSQALSESPRQDVHTSVTSEEPLAPLDGCNELELGENVD